MNYITLILCFIIRVYKIVLSPLLPASCRYLPTCSNYTYDALKIHGLFKGSWLGIKRILRCHPFGSEGFDPVPDKIHEKY